jgi:hypothetical protein
VQIPSRSEKRAAAAVLACQPAFITGPSRVPFLFFFFFRCALHLNQTGPSNTFVIRQSQRLNDFTNDLHYPTHPVDIALALRQYIFTLPPPISSHSFPACSWTVSVSCRLSHSSLSRLVRLPVYASREATFRITLSNNAGNFVFDYSSKHPTPFNTHHHACHQKRASC